MTKISNNKVYSVEEIDEAKGKAIKRHINLTPAEFTQKGWNWNQIFIVNSEERDYYQEGEAITKLMD